MKTYILFSLGLLILGSCGNVLIKRHYRHGYYFHTAQKPDVNKHLRIAGQQNDIDGYKDETRHLRLVESGQGIVTIHVTSQLSEEKPKYLFPRVIEPEPIKPACKRLQSKAQNHKADPEEKTPANKARKRSMLYLGLGIVMLVVSFLGIGDFFPLAFSLAIFFLILSLINFYRKKKYRHA